MKISKKNTLFVLLWLITAFLCLSGCNNVKYSRTDEARYFKPTIAVMGFENRAPVHTKWQLGDAMADQLTDRLMATRRYIVLERAQLQAIFQELHRTEDPEFRQVGKPERGQLKHVKYLIKGVITDFGHVEHIEGIWGAILGLFGSTSQTIVGSTIYVIDVESGQVVASSSVEAKVRDKKGGEKVKLDGMAFGGYTFYHTPIGRATNKMLDKAVHAIAKTIAEKPYQPKIASVSNNQIIINGGRNRRVKVGNEYAVRPASQRIFDPDTGDIIGHVTGQTLGRVRIVQVTERYSIAEIVQPSGTGQFTPGQTLFPTNQETSATAVASY